MSEPIKLEVVDGAIKKDTVIEENTLYYHNNSYFYMEKNIIYACSKRLFQSDSIFENFVNYYCDIDINRRCKFFNEYEQTNIDEAKYRYANYFKLLEK